MQSTRINKPKAIYELLWPKLAPQKNPMALKMQYNFIYMLPSNNMVLHFGAVNRNKWTRWETVNHLQCLSSATALLPLQSLGREVPYIMTLGTNISSILKLIFNYN